MPSVDNRVVDMQFNNAAFESKISTTIGSLDKLKTSLNFSESKKGLDDLTLASTNFKLDGIAQAVDGIASRFTAMGAAAVAIIFNIVNRAADAGIQLAKSLSLDQVLSGFREYETNLNAIQTILANTKADGTNLDDVNRALDTLNTYSDQTIYNFSQMAKNIGTFTAAGVDLDTSVNAIKGIANLAAISGSNADQASSAMYQLSQALASGSVKLMDWNSIVNAGMGGEVFQKALWETGRALGTIKDIPMGQTFEEWKEAGNSFRGSLESGWATAEVLTNTLAGFTGDLTEAQILAMGYTVEQTKGILEMGQVGKDAATKVKTLSQLITTVKETIGSGWSNSFRIVFGNFEEAKELWTGINTVLSGMASASADARNELLQGWKDIGGRTVLIEALKNAFDALRGILGPIGKAFHDVFPPMTAVTLAKLTVKFKDLMAALIPTPEVVELIRRAFRGVFSVFSIGWEVVKGIGEVFGALFSVFANTSDPSKGVLGFLANLGDGITSLKESLVDGGAISKFFGNLATSIKTFFDGLNFGNALEKFKTLISDLFTGTDGAIIDGVSAAFGRLGERFGFVIMAGKALIDFFKWLWDVFEPIRSALVSFGSFIADKMSNLPQTIADALAKTDYSQVLDTVNVGLFAALVLMFKKFFKDGPGGLFSGIRETFTGLKTLFGNIGGSFKALTGTLTAMQNNIKADTLMKIAIAVGVLTASVMILATIDSGALTKALTAMAVGFGQLIGTMALLEQATGGVMSAAKLTILAGGLILLGGAMITMAIAAKIFSTMSWGELAKGMASMAVMLGILIGTMKLMPNRVGMIATGLGIIALAVALNILALAVKAFSMMEWESMVQGLVGVGAGLVIIAGAMHLMPNGPGMLAKSVALIAVAVALNILALAVKAFSMMEWSKMGKGLAGIAATLLILAGALRLMPNGISLALQGAGLALIGIGLMSMAGAIKILSTLSWGAMTKGIAGIAMTLGLLAIAAKVMEKSIAGAFAIGIMAVSLSKLAKGVQRFADISWPDLVKGLIGLAATLVVLVIAVNSVSAGIPIMLAFGAALVLIGGAFALFGIGANFVASAFAIIATAGTQGIATLMAALDGLIEHLPAIIVAFGEGIIQLAGKLLEALPEMIANLDEVLVALLQLIIDTMPKFAETFTTFIRSGLQVIRNLFPEILATGFALLMQLLQGIRDNIAEITTTVAEIIVEFLTALAGKMGEIVEAGIQLLVSFLEGIAKNLDDLLTAAADVVAKFIEGIGLVALTVVEAGTQLIVDIITGIGNAAEQVVTAAAETVASFISGIDDNILLVIEAGWNMIIDLLNGIADSIEEHAPELRDAGLAIAWEIIDAMTFGLLSGVKDALGWVSDTIGGWFGGGDLGDGLINSLDPEAFGTAGTMAGDAFGTSTADAAKRALKINSPSKVFMRLADSVAEGFVTGLDKDKSIDRSMDSVVKNMQTSLSRIPKALEDLDDFTPTITPVLDLTKVRKQAHQLSGLLGTDSTPSYIQAHQLLSDVDERQREVVAESKEPKELTFIQNNTSPEALSTSDIYRRTRSQIAMAKEELDAA